MKNAEYICGMKRTFKSIYDETPPTGETLLLYDKGAFYTGKCVMLYGNPRFVELPGMFYPTHWAVLPESFDLQTLTPDDEPDGWTNAYYQKRGQR